MLRITATAAMTLSLLLAGCNQTKTADDQGAEASQSAAEAAACDRDCLLKATDQYLAALVAHDPKAAPMAENVAFVENVKRIQPGEGLWKSISAGPTDFKIAVPDVDQQQVGWLGVIQRDSKPTMLAMRLKFEDGKITEAEHLLTEPARGQMEHLGTPRPGLLATVPEAERLPHDKLIAIGATYYDALDDNDGSKMTFAADCQRRENGITTAGEGAMRAPNVGATAAAVARDCKGQLDSQSFVYIDRIENRRMIAADPVTGLSMGLSHFRHPMDNLPYKVIHVDGSTSERNKTNMPYEPFDMPAAHIFKIDSEGAVHEIEALGFKAPYNSPTGWE
ncbi:MAG TPA: hypothetical protein VNS79_10565 [Sphingobium sp.]|nr:hypothetical protein [Sphingobium sp.]